MKPKVQLKSKKTKRGNGSWKGDQEMEGKVVERKGIRKEIKMCYMWAPTLHEEGKHVLIQKKEGV